jgi:hypothetical protein
MEPQRDESVTADSTREQKKGLARFQIVKLEERIAPSKGGMPGKTNGCNHTQLFHNNNCYDNTGSK